MSTTEQEQTEQTTPGRVEAGITIPPRSRTFTDAEVDQVIAALDAGQNVGYGAFDSAGAARSAGVALNRLLESKGQPKRATTVFQRGEQFVGAMLPKAAKVVERKPKNNGGSKRGK